MKSIKGSLHQPDEKVLAEFICEDCSQQVVQKELIIPIGPYKGKPVVVNYGCKCADIKLAKQTVEIREKIKHDQLFQTFDNHSIINQSLKTATFKTYHPPTYELGEVKRKLMQYVNDFNKETSSNLLLVGSYGVGKSHLAVAITKELITKGYKCLFLSVPKLLTKIKQTYGGNTEFNEADVLNLVEGVDLFVLDDLGTEYTNMKNDADNWTHTKLFEVLDSRSGKPTIYTTNLTGEQLRNKVNSRNLSRIMDGTEVIEMDGPDYRMKGFVNNG